MSVSVLLFDNPVDNRVRCNAFQNHCNFVNDGKGLA
jgi:hypothetical protein